MDKESILIMLRNVQKSGTSITTDTLDDYGLGGVECAECNNTGAITRLEDGILYTKECSCMAKRRSLRRIRNSGMMDMLTRYTFANYQTPDATREKVKQKAQAFVSSDSGWLYISGKSGSGKTHICTAICSELVNKGIEVYYMSWRDESVTLKACIGNPEEYERRIKKLKRVSVLYIDDFFKAGHTEADVRLAFEIINARYNDKNLKTIISSELDIKQLLDVDEALGGRIYERSRGFVIKSPEENWRLRE